MKSRIYECKNTRKEYLDKAKSAMDARNKDAYDAAMSEVEKLNNEIEALERLDAEQGRFEDGDQKMADLNAALATQKEESLLMSRADTARSSGEYARAFTAMIRDGVNIKTGKGIAAYAPLYAALTETGGTPEGADGGFLVPVDFDTRINEVRRALRPLAEVFNLELVNTLSGWRIMDTAPGTGFDAVDEMGQVPIKDQPAFRKIEYKVTKYGQIVPISQELLDDNTAGLMSYLARWFGKKAVITENKILLALLDALTPTPIATGDEINAIKRAFNVTLDPAISVSSIVLTNQDGFSALDELADDTGRPLLQPDPANATTHRLFGRRVVVMPRSVLPNGAGVAPVFIGDFTQYGTLFRRKAFELASTNIGGNAWRTDSTEVRGLMRLDAQVFDDEAAVALEMPLA